MCRAISRCPGFTPPQLWHCCALSKKSLLVSRLLLWPWLRSSYGEGPYSLHVVLGCGWHGIAQCIRATQNNQGNTEEHQDEQKLAKEVGTLNSFRDPERRPPRPRDPIPRDMLEHQQAIPFDLEEFRFEYHGEGQPFLVPSGRSVGQSPKSCICQRHHLVGWIDCAAETLWRGAGDCCWRHAEVGGTHHVPPAQQGCGVRHSPTHSSTP